MAYTPINWDETTPINPDNLNKMDEEIDSNEERITDVENNLDDDIIKTAYPVGSIYMNANTSTNPSTLLGFGTWERFGEGRVLVGVDGSDSDFDAAEKTGGEKRHTLTESEIPYHAPTIQKASTNDGNDDAIQVSNQHEAETGSGYINSIGGGDSHNNLQPYITVYMWVRTA